jgi:hypothetical protein
VVPHRWPSQWRGGREAATQAQIAKQVTPHRLRASVATILLDVGIPLDHVLKFLRHKRIAITRIYAETSLRGLSEISIQALEQRCPQQFARPDCLSCRDPAGLTRSAMPLTKLLQVRPPGKLAGAGEDVEQYERLAVGAAVLLRVEHRSRTAIVGMSLSLRRDRLRRFDQEIGSPRA